jgi:hypothetical protein
MANRCCIEIGAEVGAGLGRLRLRVKMAVGTVQSLRVWLSSRAAPDPRGHKSIERKSKQRMRAITMQQLKDLRALLRLISAV